MYQSVVQSILTHINSKYSSWTWETTKSDGGKLNAVKINLIRRSCMVSRISYGNGEIREWIGKDDISVDGIQRSALYCTNMYREWDEKHDHNDVGKWIWNWRLPGRRERGSNYSSPAPDKPMIFTRAMEWKLLVWNARVGCSCKIFAERRINVNNKYEIDSVGKYQ